MLYSRHLVIADTFYRIRPKHRQTLTEKPAYSGHLVIADTLFWNRMNISPKNNLSIVASFRDPPARTKNGKTALRAVRVGNAGYSIANA